MSNVAQIGDKCSQKMPRVVSNAVPTRSARLGRIGKRGIDISVSSISILLLLPLLGLLCAAVWLSDGRSPIFKHRRIGRNGIGFSCLKIRSMVSDSDAVLRRHLEQNAEARAEWAQNHKLVDDPRVTALGQFLRKSSLDELPQLFNVLRGEMSLVGPRPIVDAEVTRYGEAFAQCFSVPPGITGLWQVSGRSEIGYSERIALDLRYAQGWNLGRDVAILFKTVPAVLFQKGSY
jgi:exopolysaccharide production protein ExoY